MKEQGMSIFDAQDKGLEMSSHFARFMLRLAGENNRELFLAAFLVSYFTQKGHVCLDLSAVAGQPVTETCDGAKVGETCPEFDMWIRTLKKSPIVGKPEKFKPLILDNKGRLYLYRYWEYEKILAHNVIERMDKLSEDVDLTLLQDGLKKYFPDSSTENGTDWQRIAALIAVYRMFSLISGGPGTGKTSTVIKVLALLLEQANGKALHIALTAPTGKAAARLKESIRKAKGKLACSPEILPLIPEDVSTIHRLLGTIQGSSRFRHHEGNLLPYEVIIVDEASMVDLPLMAKLVQAVPQKSRLILLGDKDQLSSVEPGAVLGDMCGFDRLPSFSKEFAEKISAISGEKISGIASDGNGELRNSLVVLPKSYRFGPDSGIGLISRAVNEGKGAEALNMLKKGGGEKTAYGDIAWRHCPRAETMAKALLNPIIKGYGDYLKTDNLEKALYHFSRFRLICALRQGPYGVVQLNKIIEKILQKAGLIKFRERWYKGQPIMVVRNDYQMELFNGDTGIILPDHSADGALRAYFPTPDGGLRKILPIRLPEHETVYAMTVHKSQGSEFDRVIFILSDRESEVLTRELIYTGLTRARKYVEVWSQEEVFLKAVSKRINRRSGLRDAMWGIKT